MPLSDPSVVKKLVMNRSKLDPCFLPGRESIDVATTAGIGLFSELVECTFIDLDILIEECDFTPYEKLYLDMIMEGYSVRDVAELNAVTDATVSKMLARAIRKIVGKNNERWYAVHAIKK